ncbi:MAG TPA: hypothetical protein VGP68_10150 [Gemmataceae bacterium]|jgi:hypothetical protein|nr:hypothetical protein [Gemmataceae bacterium]
MRIVSLPFLLTIGLVATWAPTPQQKAELPLAESMPKVEDTQELPIKLRLEGPVASWVGSPSSLTIRITNSGDKPAKGLLLSATFEKQLEHETKANPVELPLPELMSGEMRRIPLVLTPSQPGEFLVRVSLTGEKRLNARAECKIKADVATSYVPPQLDYHGATSIRSFVFAQAQTQSGGIGVSFLSTAYVLRTYYPGGYEKGPQGHYYEPITSEVRNEYPADQIRAMTAAGKHVDSQELSKALKQKTTVLLFSEHETIDPFILAMFKPETMILILPAPAQQAAASEKTVPVPVKVDGKSLGVRPYPPTNRAN